MEISALLAALFSCALLLRPDARRLIVATAVVFAVFVFSGLPAVPNHRLVLLFVAIGIIIGGGSDSMWSRVPATLRWLTLIVYGFAGLAKVNETYLLPEVSCAATFTREALALHGIPLGNLLSDLVVSLSPWWALVTELALLVLLPLRRTRGLGIALGVSFHVGLATHYIKHFANFSSTMFILLLSWLNEEQCRSLWTRYIDRWRFAFFLGAATVTALSFGRAFGYLTFETLFIARYVIFMAYGIFILYAIVQDFLRPPDVIDGASRPLGLVLALAILMGLAPYIGLKNRGGLAMYSNFRVEPGYSNHLVVRRGSDIAGYLSDTVKVLSHDDSKALGVADGSEQRVPYIALCAYLNRLGLAYDLSAGSHEVTWERHGVVSSARFGGSAPTDCPSLTAQKLLFFGPVGAGTELECRW